MAGLQGGRLGDPMPSPELLPYAERLFSRFPELVVALGDPHLGQVFQLPRDGESSVHVREFGSQQVVQVSLQRRCPLPGAQTPGAWPYWSQRMGHVGCAETNFWEPVWAAPAPHAPATSVVAEPALQPMLISDSVHQQHPFGGTGVGSAAVQSPLISGSWRQQHHQGADAGVARSAASPQGRQGRHARSTEQDDRLAIVPGGKQQPMSAAGRLDKSECQGPMLSHDLDETILIEPYSPRSPGHHSPWGGSFLVRRSGSDRSHPSSVPTKTRSPAALSLQRQPQPCPASPSPSLQQRRQKRGAKLMTLDLQDKKSLSNEESNKMKEPSVILERPLSLPPRRCLPGAFPHQRTIFFFDWDDTLCPTTWIRSVLKDQINDRLEWDPKAVETMVDWLDMIPQWFRHKLPDNDSFCDMMNELQSKAISVIKLAQQFGVVCIVTNSLPGWVDMTIKKWLPALTQYVNGHGMAQPPIKVLYSQELKAPAPLGMTELAWVPDSDGSALMKRDAMSIALCEVEEVYRMGVEDGEDSSLPCHSWCSSSSSKTICSVVSVGNDEAEMRGAELATLGYGSWRLGRRLGQRRAAASINPTPSSSSGSMLRRNQSSAGPAPKPWRCPRAISVNIADRQLPDRPWLKCLKFTECPHVRDLTEHLEDTMKMIPYLAGLRGHMRHELDARFAGLTPPSTRTTQAGEERRQAAAKASAQRRAASLYPPRHACGLEAQMV